MFTWQVYTCLSSYPETYDTARMLVASSASLFQAEDALREWVREMVEEWFDQCPESAFKVLIASVLQNALGQVDWAHVTRAFDESGH